MAIPTDHPNCVGWHEASVETPADGANAAFRFSGINGLPHGPTQANVTDRPHLATLVSGAFSGRRVYRFVSGFASGHGLTTAINLATKPCTLIVAYAHTQATIGDRRTISGSTGWMHGARSDGKFHTYNPADLDGGAQNLDVHIHTWIMRAAGVLTEHRIDGVPVGTSVGTAAPGLVNVSGFFTERPFADILGMSGFDTELIGTDLTDQEAYWMTGGGGSITTIDPLFTQHIIEPIYNADPFVGNSQHLIEAFYNASSFMRVSQHIIEVIYRDGNHDSRVSGGEGRVTVRGRSVCACLRPHYGSCLSGVPILCD